MGRQWLSDQGFWLIALCTVDYLGQWVNGTGSAYSVLLWVGEGGTCSYQVLT